MEIDINPSQSVQAYTNTGSNEISFTGVSGKRVAFIDREPDKYSIVAQLGSFAAGKKCIDKTLAARTISVIEGFSQDNKRCCIVGSRVLQRIIGIRYYAGDIESARKIYQTDDLDIWVNNEETKKLLIEKIQMIPFESNIEKITFAFPSDLFNSQHGIIQSRIILSLASLKDKSEEHSSVDISCPLFLDKPFLEECNGKTRSRFSRYLAASEPIIMHSNPTLSTGEVSGGTERVGCNTLNDMDYLGLLAEVLESKTVTPATLAKQKDALKLLFYYELTRRLLQGQSEVDDFCRLLFALIQQYLPDMATWLWSKMPDWPEIDPTVIDSIRHQEIKTPFTYEGSVPYATLLPSLYPKAVPVAKSVPESSVKSIMGARIQKEEGIGGQVKSDDSVREQQCRPCTLIRGAQVNEIQGEKLRSTETVRSISEAVSLTDAIASRETAGIAVSNNEEACIAKKPAGRRAKSRKQKNSKEITHQLSGIRADPEMDKFFKKQGSGLPTQVIDDYLVSRLQKSSVSAQDWQRLESKYSQLRLTLNQVSFAIDTPCYSPDGAPTCNIKPEALESLNDKAISKLISKQQDIPMPYHQYFKAIWLMKKVLPDVHEVQDCLISSALAGVTGAALALLHYALQTPESTVPISLSMNMLKMCLERDEKSQFSIRFRLYREHPVAGVADRILQIIQRQLLMPVNQTFWSRLGNSLVGAQVQVPEDRQYFQLMAATAFNFAGNTEQSLKVYSGISKKDRKKFSTKMAFDWYLQGIPAQLEKLGSQKMQSGADTVIRQQSDSPLIKQNIKVSGEGKVLESMVQQLLLNNTTGLNDAVSQALSSSEKLTAGWLLKWLNFCLPVNLRSYYPKLASLSNFTKEFPLLRQWRQLEETQRACTGALTAETVAPNAPVKSEPYQPVLECLKAKEIVAYLDGVANETGHQSIARYNQHMDALFGYWFFKEQNLKWSLPADCEDPDHPVSVGCRKIVEAIRDFGGRIQEYEQGKMTFVLSDVNPAFKKKLVRQLGDIIGKYGNPYACWIYARLIRNELLPDMVTGEGLNQWHEHYLGVLFFAAMMKVDGALIDLVMEFVGGRADPFLVSIATLLAERYKKTRLSICADFPAIQHDSFLLWLQKYEGNQSEWSEDLLRELNGWKKGVAHHTCLIKQHRFFLVNSTVSSFLGYKPKVSPIAEHKALLPRALQIMPRVIKYFLQSLQISVDFDGRKDLLPEVLRLSKAWKFLGATPDLFLKELLAGDEQSLLPCLQWTPAFGRVSEATRLLQKKTISTGDKSIDLRGSEALMGLYWQQIMLDHGRLDLGIRTPLATAGRHWLSVNSIDSYSCVPDILNLRPCQSLSDSKLLKELKTHRKSGEGSRFIKLLGNLKAEYNKEVPNVIQLKNATLVKAFDLIKDDVLMPATFKQQYLAYFYLLKAKLAEVAYPTIQNSRQMLELQKYYFQAAIQGCDEAVRQLAIMAMDTGSWISMSRVLDLYLSQYFRPYRQRLLFESCNNNLNVLPTVSKEILSILDKACLKPPEAMKSLSQLIEEDIFPDLEALFLKQKGVILEVEIIPKLIVLITACQAYTNKDLKIYDLVFNGTESSRGLTLIQFDQWALQLKRLSTSIDQLKSLYIRFNDIIAQKRESLYASSEKGDFVHLMSLFSSRIHLQTWDSDVAEHCEFYEEDRFMLFLKCGQAELEYFQRSVVEMDPKIQSGSSNNKLNGYYEFMVMNRFIQARLSCQPLILPLPNNQQQQVVFQYWSSVYRSEVNSDEKFGGVENTGPTADDNSEKELARKKHRRKKKKPAQQHSIGNLIEKTAVPKGGSPGTSKG